MKTLKLSIYAIAIAFGFTTFTGCSKGDTGAAGAAGASGTNGTNGTNGNANVVTTNFTVPAWSYDGPHAQWYAAFSVSALTSSIADGGAVEVFLSVDNGYSWNALPSVYISSPSLTANWTYAFSPGSVDVYFTWSNLTANTDPNTLYGDTCQFNVVCIAASTMQLHPHFNWKDYKAVMGLDGVAALKPE